MMSLENIIQILMDEGVTAYKIAQKTSLTEAAIGKIFNGKTKNPQQSTIDILNNYILSHTNFYPKVVNEEGNLYSSDENPITNRIIELKNGQYWLSMPLIEPDDQKTYLTSFQNPRFIEELPTHSMITDQVDRRNYMAFRVNGHSMEDGTHKGIEQGAILTCRKLPKPQWQTLISTEKRPYWVIIHKSGVLFKQIIDSDGESIVCHSLNKSPEFNDFKIPTTEILQLYYAVKVTRSVGDMNELI